MVTRVKVTYPPTAGRTAASLVGAAPEAGDAWTESCLASGYLQRGDAAMRDLARVTGRLAETG